MLNILMLGATALLGSPSVTWEAPARFIEGSAFSVSIQIEVPSEGAAVAGWLFTPAAFTIDGKPVAQRKGKSDIQLAPGSTLSLSFDLGSALKTSPGYAGKEFKLGFAKGFSDAPVREVAVCVLAPTGLDFMKVPLEDLSGYQVIMSTNQGDMLLEFWPETAPNHVRNFLDLCYTHFYDGVIFHRVIPDFMIQGGDPTGTGSGPGKRMLDAEFTTDPKYKHVPGVLSMARTGDPNSASSQFFVMHKTSPHLDGQYSVFGKCIDGMDVVERIVSVPRGANDRPKEKQFIKSATVIVAPK